MENPRNKQFIHFKLPAVLSSVVKSPVIPFCPAQDRNQESPSVQCVHTGYTTRPLAT